VRDNLEADRHPFGAFAALVQELGPSVVVGVAECLLIFSHSGNWHNSGREAEGVPDASVLSHQVHLSGKLIFERTMWEGWGNEGFNASFLPLLADGSNEVLPLSLESLELVWCQLLKSFQSCDSSSVSISYFQEIFDCLGDLE